MNALLKKKFVKRILKAEKGEFVRVDNFVEHYFCL